MSNEHPTDAAARAGAQHRDPTQPQRVTALPVDWSTEPAPAYANGAHVVHTPREFAVVFDDTVPFPGRLAQPEDPSGTRGRIVASLRLAPDAFFQVVCALASSWNRFAATYLEGQATRPRFVLVDAGAMKLDGQDGTAAPTPSTPPLPVAVRAAAPTQT